MSGYLLMCPGQGAQHPGMLDFALTDDAGRAALDEASEAAGVDLVARVRAGTDLHDAQFAQVSVVAATCASWRALAAHLPAPAAIAGYSIGEVSSWACAGTWTIAQAIALTRRRAELMIRANPPDAAMTAATGIARERLEPLLANGVHVAIEVESGHCILAGPRPALDATTKALVAAGATLHPLPVTVASHTPWLAEAAAALRPYIEKLGGRDPQPAVLRGTDARHLARARDAAAAICDAIAQTIRWSAVLQDASERGWATAIELPPGRALARIAGDRFATPARAVEDFRSPAGVAQWLDRALNPRHN